MLGIAASFLLLTAAAPGEAPSWSKGELKKLVGQAHAVAQLPFGPAQDQALAQLGGEAFRVPPQPGEPLEPFAERAVKIRQPRHPAISKGQWVLALTRQLYADIGERCAVLKRFERDPKDDQFLGGCANEFQNVAREMAKDLKYIIEGLEGFMDPLPIADGDEPQPIGCLILVRKGVITIENLDRAHFENDQPPANATRTKRGSLRELYSAQKLFNDNNKMIGMYEAAMRRQVGHVRVAIAGNAPALYLNEVFRGAREAEMKTLHLLTMSSSSVLRELPLLVSAPSPPKRKPKLKKGQTPPPEPVEVRCSDELTMSLCVRKIDEARKAGPVLYQVD